jgi:hypothetical protein
MPYKSQAQRAYFNANKAKMESQGVSVKEWNEASKGKKLPKKVKRKSDVQSSSMWRQGQHE